jgi:excisionase family DNA binding protein
MSYSGLALRTGLSIRTLKRLVAERKIPHIRYTEHSIRFDKAAIEGWITERSEAVKPKAAESDAKETA